MENICEVAEVLIGRLGSFDSSDKVLISDNFKAVAHLNTYVARFLMLIFSPIGWK